MYCGELLGTLLACILYAFVAVDVQCLVPYIGAACDVGNVVSRARQAAVLASGCTGSGSWLEYSATHFMFSGCALHSMPNLGACIVPDQAVTGPYGLMPVSSSSATQRSDLPHGMASQLLGLRLRSHAVF
jgi:hypothetical protein